MYASLCLEHVPSSVVFLFSSTLLGLASKMSTTIIRRMSTLQVLIVPLQQELVPHACHQIDGHQECLLFSLAQYDGIAHVMCQLCLQQLDVLLVRCFVSLQQLLACDHQCTVDFELIPEADRLSL